ncbi:MAG: phosphate/phosphite/phosphonate ABC transporter substrate-binding protein [Pseudomonadota bacterium]
MQAYVKSAFLDRRGDLFTLAQQLRRIGSMQYLHVIDSADSSMFNAKKNVFMRKFVSGILVPVCVLISAKFAHSADNKVTLTVGVVPQLDVRRTFEIWQPILEALEKQSGLTFILAPSLSISEHLKRIESGGADLLYTNPYFARNAIVNHGYAPLIRDAEEMLTGILIVRTDSPIEKLAEIRDQIVAFPHPEAFAATTLMRYSLTQQHINVMQKYVGSHQSVMLNVVLGQVIAGSIASSIYDLASADLRDNLRILYRTPETVPHPLLTHPRVSTTTRHLLVQAILELASTPQGRELFARIPMKKPGPATVQEYISIPDVGGTRPESKASPP